MTSTTQANCVQNSLMALVSHVSNLEDFSNSFKNAVVIFHYKKAFYLHPLEAIGGQPGVLDGVLEASHHLLNVAHPARCVAVDIFVDTAMKERFANPNFLEFEQDRMCRVTQRVVDLG